MDRFTFETKGEGFEKHLKEDHWMWTYLAMMIQYEQLRALPAPRARLF